MLRDSAGAPSRRAPVGEASREGRVVLSYDTRQAGDLLRVWLQFEVNPTNVGRRSYAIDLDDTERPIARLACDITVLPRSDGPRPVQRLRLRPHLRGHAGADRRDHRDRDARAPHVFTAWLSFRMRRLRPLLETNGKISFATR